MLLYDSVWCWFHWNIHWLIFRVRFLKKEIYHFLCALGSDGGFPKMEIAPFGIAILGNICSLLLMMSSNNRNISLHTEYSCGTFFGMYSLYVCALIHYVRMQKMPVVHVRMQHVLLTVDNSEEQQMIISPSILAICVALFWRCPH